MPMDRSLYPANWEAIALAVKEAANWTCQECDRPCRSPGESVSAFIGRINNDLQSDWLDDLFDEENLRMKTVRFTLTVAHLDHDPWNPNARLRALCAPCHCRYDLKALPLKRRLKRERLGQLNLLEADRHAQS